MAIQDVLNSTNELLKRVQTEGVTQNGKTILQPGAFNASTGQIKIPETQQITPDISTAQGRTSYYQQLIEAQQAEAEAARVAREQAQAQQVENKSALQKIQEKFGLIGEKRTEGLSALGFEPVQQFAQQKAQLAEVDALYTDYNNAVAQRDKQIANLMGAGGGMDFQNNAVAQINRNANVLLTQKSSNINQKLAMIEAQNQNWESAQKFVDQSIKDWTAGLQAEYDLTSKFYDDNQDLIDSLGKEYSDALKQRQALILDQIETARQDKQQEIDNAFKREGLDLQWAQESRLGDKTSNEDLNSDLASISKYGSRETALSELNKIKTSAINKYGESGYQQLLNEVDRLYPIPGKKTPSIPSNQGAAQAGQATRGAIFNTLNLGGYGTDIIGKPLVEGTKAVTSFFQGLFQ